MFFKVEEEDNVGVLSLSVKRNSNVESSDFSFVELHER